MALPTQDEIVARIEDRRGDKDPLDFEWPEYVEYLDYEHIRPFLAAEWVQKYESGEEKYTGKPDFTRDDILKKMEDYLAFAWEKANNCRGISANRSIQHYIAWTWLAGDQEFSAKVEELFEKAYMHYGKGILATIAEKYGWDWTALDNGKWQSEEYIDGDPADSAYAKWCAGVQAA